MKFYPIMSITKLCIVELVPNLPPLGQFQRCFLTASYKLMHDYNIYWHHDQPVFLFTNGLAIFICPFYFYKVFDDRQQTSSHLLHNFYDNQVGQYFCLTIASHSGDVLVTAVIWCDQWSHYHKITTPSKHLQINLSQAYPVA